MLPQFFDEPGVDVYRNANEPEFPDLSHIPRRMKPVKLKQLILLCNIPITLYNFFIIFVTEAPFSGILDKSLPFPGGQQFYHQEIDEKQNTKYYKNSNRHSIKQLDYLYVFQSPATSS